jgi:K+-transporting ATPase ATPase C chain
VVTAVAQVGFSEKANGSELVVNGTVVGSKLLGQTFTKPTYFHGRPSAAGAAASGTGSGDPEDVSQDISAGSNWGPTNPDLLAAVKQRVADYRKENRLASDVRVPVDAVTASGSGLDPQISIANARLQAGRVARARNLSEYRVEQLIDDHTEGRSLGVLGDPGVNVLELNVALDHLRP